MENMAFCALYHATMTQLQIGNVQNGQKKSLKKLKFVHTCADTFGIIITVKTPNTLYSFLLPP